MKINSSQADGLKRTYEIVIASKEVDDQLASQLESIGKKAKIPGFRPGKIPMSVLKQRYGKEVMDEVLWNSINQATRKLVEDEDIRPATKPDVHIQSYEDGGDLAFELKMEIMPDVPAIDYESITIADYQIDIPDSEIEEGLERLRNSRKHYHAASDDKIAANGDAVKIDFVGKLNGEPFEGGKGEGFQLELGSGQFIPGFEEQLEGVKAGDEKTITVTFPEQYHSSNLAGKEATFDVTVHSVLEPHIPELNDEFAQELGLESLDALRNAVKDQVMADYQQMARNKAKKQLFDHLDDTIQFDVPEQMKEMEFQGVWEQLQRAKAEGDESLNKPEEELKTEYQAIAERRVKLGILLSEIGRQNNLQVSKDELTQAVMRQAQMFPGQERKVFEFYQKNPDHVDELRGPIIEDKAVDFILERVKREPKTVSAEELAVDDEAPAISEKKKAASSKKKTAKKKPETKSDGSAESNKKSVTKAKSSGKSSSKSSTKKADKGENA